MPTSWSDDKIDELKATISTQAARIATLEMSSPWQPDDPPEEITAFEALKFFQRQLDQDGVEVGVSRQALDDVLEEQNRHHGPKGVFKCSACGFTQMFSKMRASDGAVGVHDGPYDTERLVCPNDDTLLHALTWQESEANAWKIAEGYLATISKLEDDLESVENELRDVDSSLTMSNEPEDYNPTRRQRASDVMATSQDRDRTISTQAARIEALTAELSDHRKHVGAFLNDLYAVLIDPCAEKNMSVQECCSALLDGAQTQRQFIADLQARIEALIAIVDGARTSLEAVKALRTSDIERRPEDDTDILLLIALGQARTLAIAGLARIEAALAKGGERG